MERVSRQLLSDSTVERRPLSAHLIGIGGAGMQSLAAVLSAQGWRISGSDVNPNAARESALSEATIHVGHAAANVPRDAGVVIYSDAISAENVERHRAADLGIRLLSYPEMLGEMSRDSTTFAVAGTHGKSTTTAMAAAAMVRAGLDPTVICGATLIGCRSGGRAASVVLQASRLPGHLRQRVAAGTAAPQLLPPPFLVEACEYRANFLNLSPHAAAVLGVEMDHFDYYHSREQLFETFERFVARIPRDGFLVVNNDCATSRALTASALCRISTFGLHPRADWSARHLQTRRGRYRFWLTHCERPLAEVVLQVPGKHNVLNALAAAALATEAGAPPETIAAALSSFRGLKRRLEVVGRRGGVTLIDDYAHHPTEIRATLTTVRQMYPGRRIWCIFQPHQASRTAALLDELAASLHNADKVAVAEIFRSREASARPGEVTAADLLVAITAGGTGKRSLPVPDVLERHDFDDIAVGVSSDLRPGDVLITMGAGDIGKIGQTIHQRLRKDRARS
jgi:UDP-N-acetylmuramate--alanine ligase